MKYGRIIGANGRQPPGCLIEQLAAATQDFDMSRGTPFPRRLRQFREELLRCRRRCVIGLERMVRLVVGGRDHDEIADVVWRRLIAGHVRHGGEYPSAATNRDADGPSPHSADEERLLLGGIAGSAFLNG